MVRFEFDNIDFTKQTQRKRMPEASDLMLRADTLAIQYEDYTPTETSKNVAECREKKSSLGQFTEPVSFPRGENEQYLCLPEFVATVDGKKMGMKITKTTSVDKEDNDGLYYHSNIKKSPGNPGDLIRLVLQRLFVNLCNHTSTNGTATFADSKV